MVEIKAITYEQARSDFLKAEMEKAQNRMKFWQTKIKKAKNAIAEMGAHDNASNAGWEYNYYKDALEALENQPKWLSPTEGLPEPNTTVIVALDDGHVFQARYNYDGWDWWEGFTGTVMCWMPMPTPPKED